MKTEKKKKRKRIPIYNSKSVMIESRLAVSAANGSIEAQALLMKVMSL
jgi:hypothetical protein